MSAAGILHSPFHELWSLRLGTSLEDRPCYTPSTTFETFPFPAGLTPDMPATEYAADPRAIAVAEATQRLVELRDRWLNPPEWVEWVDEPVPGYPRRAVPRDEETAKALRKRTLTNLYNARPQWLANAHTALDAAVAAAYSLALRHERQRRPSRATESQRRRSPSGGLRSGLQTRQRGRFRSSTHFTAFFDQKSCGVRLHPLM